MTDPGARDVDLILRTRFHELTATRSAHIVLLRRKPEPFRHPKEWESELASVLRDLLPLSRPGWRLLYDLRESPGRNDRPFEASTFDFRRRVLTLFDPTSVIVRTAAGKMQMTRYIRESASSARVFEDFRTGAIKLGAPLSLADGLDHLRQAALGALAVGQL